MKQAINFRLKPQSILILTALADELHITRTEVIERSLKGYYEKKHHQQTSSLLSLFGSISDDDANSMLKTIKENRVNKSDNIKL